LAILTRCPRSLTISARACWHEFWHFPNTRALRSFSRGDDDLELFVRASGLDPATARKQLRDGRRHGRTPSASAGDEG
jgi:hypothetical protein